MTLLRTTLIVTATAALGLAACSPAKTAKDTGESTAAQPAEPAKNPINSAMSAAPQTVGANATIVTAAADGTMTTLRKGTNGFTCMPDNPVTPGADPMCMDANALQWGMAWMTHAPPPQDMPGIMYMLSGGTDASNTDPFARKPTSGADWIQTGPHVMLVGSAKALKGYPSGPDPDPSAPYVMWAGTPYAHLMIPVG